MTLPNSTETRSLSLAVDKKNLYRMLMTAQATSVKGLLENANLRQTTHDPIAESDPILELGRKR
jgi:hypothetical protein